MGCTGGGGSGCFGGGSGLGGGNLSLALGLYLGKLLGSRLGLGLFGQIVELLHQSVAGEHGLLEIIAEFQRVGRTSGNTELAECAAAQIIEILYQFLFLSSARKRGAAAGRVVRSSG